MRCAYVIPLVTLLLAGCAAPPPGAGPSVAGPSTPTAAALQAQVMVLNFLDICGTFDQAQMDRQARSTGFVPVTTSQLSPESAEALRQMGDLAYLRYVPGRNLRSIVIWASGESRCTCLLGGVDPGEVERAFLSLTERMGTGDLAIHRIPAEEVARINQRGRPSTELRQAAVLGPRPPARGRHASISLAFHAGPDVILPVSMIYAPHSPPASLQNAPRSTSLGNASPPRT